MSNIYTTREALEAYADGLRVAAKVARRSLDAFIGDGLPEPPDGMPPEDFAENALRAFASTLADSLERGHEDACKAVTDAR